MVDRGAKLFDLIKLNHFILELIKITNPRNYLSADSVDRRLLASNARSELMGMIIRL